MFPSLLGVRTIALVAVCWLGAALRGADTATVEHPFLGVTHITRFRTPPDYQVNSRMHIVKIDLTAPSLSFRLTGRGGTMDVLRQATLAFANQHQAQIAMNVHFLLPFPGDGVNADLIGFASSNGDIFSPFELPQQNYAILRDAPGLNIDPNNNASIVTRAPGFSDGQCFQCVINDGLHVNENVTIWTAVSGSAQIITNGVKTIPCYVDAMNPDCKLVGPGPANYSNSNSWYNLFNARAVIGLSQDNKTLFLFTVDNAGGSNGMRIGDISDLLISEYGVYNALNLDGGGSVTLVMENPTTHVRALVNSHSNGGSGPRVVASNLAVFASTNTNVTHNVVTSPANLSFSVDGTNFTSEQSAVWPYGSSHALATTSPQQLAPGTQYVFASWSDGGALSHTVNGGHSATIYTANFDTQHQLTATASPAPGGSVSPGSGQYFNASSTVSLQAAPNHGYAFHNWTGPVTNANSASTTAVMTGPLSVTANFVPAPVLSGNVTGKSGPAAARTSTITLANTGPGAGTGARITNFALTQTSGAACTPVVMTPLPVEVGDIAPGVSANGTVTVNYSGCAPANRYTVTFGYSANSGAVTGSRTLYNQFQ